MLGKSERDYFERLIELLQEIRKDLEDFNNSYFKTF